MTYYVQFKGIRLRNDYAEKLEELFNKQDKLIQELSKENYKLKEDIKLGNSRTKLPSYSEEER